MPPSFSARCARRGAMWHCMVACNGCPDSPTFGASKRQASHHLAGNSLGACDVKRKHARKMSDKQRRARVRLHQHVVGAFAGLAGRPGGRSGHDAMVAPAWADGQNSGVVVPCMAPTWGSDPGHPCTFVVMSLDGHRRASCKPAGRGERPEQAHHALGITNGRPGGAPSPERTLHHSFDRAGKLGVTTSLGRAGGC